jgi:uncharacterized membrane protein YgdD (TMEM256/DUF423 family)
MTKMFLIVGAILGGLSVAMGAFGAHGLEGRLDERALQNWETAARYQMYHALALLAVAWLSQQVEHVAANVAGIGFIAGIVIFSGSLYVLSFTGIRWLGAITPIGGLAFLIGWGALAFAASKLV